MKMGRTSHIVPLARQAVTLLKELQKLTGWSEWVFPNQVRPRDHMSNGTILKALERLGYKGRMTGHGFRALAKSSIKERLGYREEVVDRQLAHASQDPYDRAKYLDERRVMMRDWADYLDRLEQDELPGSALIERSNVRATIEDPPTPKALQASASERAARAATKLAAGQ
jgi:integrase